MEDLFTTKQVQELLKVDRITIYRMLQDGRIKGVKIGQQWRFPRHEVERMMSGEVSFEEPKAAADESTFPVHCLQTIQNLFSGVSQLSALIVDREGEPVTQTSSQCTFCRLVDENAGGYSACQDCWRSFSEKAAAGETEFTCHAGLRYLAEPVMVQDHLVAFFLTGQFLWQGEEAALSPERVRVLAERLGIDPVRLDAAAREVPVVPAPERKQVTSWPRAAAQAAESILQERSNFLQRLQQIANLTQIS